MFNIHQIRIKYRKQDATFIFIFDENKKSEIRFDPLR